MVNIYLQSVFWWKSRNELLTDWHEWLDSLYVASTARVADTYQYFSCQ